MFQTRLKAEGLHPYYRPDAYSSQFPDHLGRMRLLSFVGSHVWQSFNSCSNSFENGLLIEVKIVIQDIGVGSTTGAAPSLLRIYQS